MQIIATQARRRRGFSGFGKIVFVIFVSSWLAAAVVTGAAQNIADKADPQSLIHLEGSWNEAFYRKDVSFLEQVLADEFIATYEDGSRGDTMSLRRI